MLSQHKRTVPIMPTTHQIETENREERQKIELSRRDTADEAKRWRETRLEDAEASFLHPGARMRMLHVCQCVCVIAG